jgi:flagellin-like protein
MRTNEEGVSPVIATILMVAITVVLAAVLYVMVTNLIGPQPIIRPIVTMQDLGCDATSCRARVTEASPAVNVDLFRVTVLADGNPAIPATDLAAGVDISGGGLILRYTDLGGEGKVTGGDTFSLTGISAGVAYEVVILWNDGAAVQTVVLSA